MRILWTAEALDDLEAILVYYHVEAGARTANAVERRIIGQIEALSPFPERIRSSERIPGARELVIDKLPYIVFVRTIPDGIVVLNIVHAARKFPA
jgi:plasmid stabilization system protein ParE